MNMEVEAEGSELGSDREYNRFCSPGSSAGRTFL